MTDLALFPELMPEEQFRAVRLQVHNWGTFSGCNDIPIAEEGFLFVGAYLARASRRFSTPSPSC